MKRHLAIVFASLLAFAVGELAYDVTHPPIAEASGGSGSAGGTCGTGTGSAVCATSPTLTTPVLGVASATTLTVAPGSATNAVSITANGIAEGLYSLSANNSSSNACQCDGSGAGAGLYASSAGASAAITAVNSTNGAGGGNALVLTGDLTSPSYGAILWSPADAVPSAAGAAGNLAMATVSSVANLYLNQGAAVYHAVSGVLPQTTNLTAFAGGGQASATLVCAAAGKFVVTTVATAGDSVKLPPTPTIGQLCEVVNADGTDAMNLYPGSGDQLCVVGAGCLGADTATSITATIRMRSCRAQTTAVWDCQ